MSFTFKDKLELRQLQSKMHSSNFGIQNEKIAKSLNIDPRWMFQSRLNYRYIYKEKNSFWPDWAKEQYLESNNDTYYPINDLYCLNLLDKQFFSFINSENNFRVDVNKTGYISFPFLNFGIQLQSYEGHSFKNFFKDDIVLSNSGPTITYSNSTDNLSSMFSFDFDSSSSIIKLSVSFKNLTDKAISNSFSLGILPYTNEGVGSIKTINYLSNQRFVINDRFFMQCCSQPSNVICTTFEQGNIFDRSLEWEMIFDAKCSDFLASGLINYTNKIQKNDTVSYEFYFSYSNHHIIPLLPPFNKIKNK